MLLRVRAVIRSTGRAKTRRRGGLQWQARGVKRRFELRIWFKKWLHGAFAGFQQPIRDVVAVEIYREQRFCGELCQRNRHLRRG